MNASRIEIPTYICLLLCLFTSFSAASANLRERCISERDHFIYILSASTFIAQITWIIGMWKRQAFNVHTDERVSFHSIFHTLAAYSIHLRGILWLHFVFDYRNSRAEKQRHDRLLCCHRRRWWRQLHGGCFLPSTNFYEMNAHDLCTWRIWLLAQRTKTNVHCMHRKQHMAKVYVSTNDSHSLSSPPPPLSSTTARSPDSHGQRSCGWFRLLTFCFDLKKLWKFFCFFCPHRVVNSSAERQIGDNYYHRV